MPAPDPNTRATWSGWIHDPTDWWSGSCAGQGGSNREPRMRDLREFASAVLAWGPRRDAGHPTGRGRGDLFEGSKPRKRESRHPAYREAILNGEPRSVTMRVLR